MDERMYGEEPSSQPLPPEFAPPPPEELSLPDDVGPVLPPEDALPPDDSATPLRPEEYPSPESQNQKKKSGSSDSARENRHRNLKQLFLLPVAASLAAVSILFAALGYDPIGWDLFNSGSSSSSSSGADRAFPSLINLTPNGVVTPNPYSPFTSAYITNEDFITLDYANQPSDYIHAGLYWQTYANAVEVNVTGISYDEDTNTIHLTDFSGSCCLNINMMGNGLTLELTGENKLDQLKVWGWFYGGSIKITGSGSLIINENQTQDCGIYLKGECSQTCLMIDRGVTVEAFGTEAAVYVEDSSMEKGVYYLEPLTLSGGVPLTLLDKNAEGYHCHTFMDIETGEYAKHITFQ